MSEGYDNLSALGKAQYIYEHVDAISKDCMADELLPPLIEELVWLESDYTDIRIANNELARFVIDLTSDELLPPHLKNKAMDIIRKYKADEC